MTFTDYHKEFGRILAGENTEKPYGDLQFLEYVKLNNSRQNRWLKKGILSPETQSTIQSISQKQTWLVITEPWCGDSAHALPFIQKMAELNPNITLKIQYRDSEGSEIDKYLTNGGKSIPKLIVRNTNGEDMFSWGPRTEACQQLVVKLKEEHKTSEEQKINLQQWYNDDQGFTIQNELSSKLTSYY